MEHAYTSPELTKNQKNQAGRLLSIDIVRGIAIFGVLFIHPMIFGTWYPR